MLTIYRTLAGLALNEFKDIITQTSFVGGTPISPNKLRLMVTDGSFVDIWLSGEGDYSFHWERRRQSGEIYRWDNAPHHANLKTFPDHFHHGDEPTVVESELNPMPEDALRGVLKFIKQHL